MHAERGAAAVEFALVLVVLLLILLGIIDFGRLLFVSQAVKSASREGARVAIVKGPYASKALEAAGPAISMSGTSSFACKIEAISAGGAFLADPSAGAACSTDPTPCVAPSGQPKREAIRVYTEVTFKWLTPVGSLPGLAIPSLQGNRPVSSTTTMRCEGS